MDARREDRWTAYESPLGVLTIVVAPDGSLRGLRFPDRAPGSQRAGERRPPDPIARQLDEYFAGTRRRFELPVSLIGTRLQLAVWGRLSEIPYGTTVSYGELAARLDPTLMPPDLEPYKQVRAVAAEVGRTPVPIVVPCHRVLGADGSLTGYGGGLSRKRALLDLEQGAAQLPLASPRLSPSARGSSRASPSG